MGVVDAVLLLTPPQKPGLLSVPGLIEPVSTKRPAGVAGRQMSREDMEGLSTARRIKRMDPASCSGPLDVHSV